VSDIKPKKTQLATGFGGSYEDTEQPLSLDKLANQVPSATFYFRVSGDNKGANLGDGDIAVVDRSLDPVNNAIIVAVVDSELVIRRYMENEDSIELFRDGDEPSEVMVKEEFELWGVVTYSFKQHWPVND
jgi:DNA polymerase V